MRGPRLFALGEIQPFNPNVSYLNVNGHKVKKSSPTVIRATISAFDRDGINCIDKLGTKLKSISPRVTKYSTIIRELDYFIVFAKVRGGTEISFVGDGCAISLAEVEKEFGWFEVHYNFGENYSEFTFHISSAIIADLYFVKDNKFEAHEPGGFIETTPQGQATNHADLAFNAFCLRLRP